MTNPDNIVRVRARNGGRASVYEANGWCQAFSTGLLEGNGVIQNTVADMNVLVGGSITKPDVVIATNPAGYKIALDIVGQQAVAITAPASNKRISAIVAYTDDLSLPTTQDTVTGAPGSCGLIVVNGTAASSPTAPNDTTIRSAITADGATGSQASYCVIATILVENGTTAITSSEITTNKAGVTSQNIDFATFIVSNQDSTEKAVSAAFSDALSVDISGIPIGSKFLVIFTASASGTNEINGYFLRIRYGSEYSIIYGQGNSWGKNVAGQCVFTKLDGQNNVVLQHKKDQSYSVIGTVRACSCIVVK